MINEFKTNLKQLFKDKQFLVFTILIAVAAYGFTITHFAIGIDDFGVNHYMNLSPTAHGNMLQQGRLLHILFFYITGLVDVIPYLNNFLGAALLVISAILLTALIETVIPNKFTIFAKIMFAGLFLSNPIISFKFIYDLDVVVTMFSYACIPLAVIFGLEFCQTSNKLDFLKAFGFLLCSIGSYESFNAVYICLVIFTLILYAVYKNVPAKELVIKAVKLAVILICAFAFYYIVVKICQYATGNISYPRSTILSIGIPVKTAVKNIIKSLLNFSLFPILEFAVFAGLSTLLALFLSIKTKRPIIMLLFILMGFFTVSVSLIQGMVFYRTCQPFNLFVACIALLLIDVMSDKKALRQASAFVMVLLLIWQLKDINLWFYKDWANYQKNEYAINTIATDLHGSFSVEDKPVCFVTRDYDSFLMSWDASQHEIGESPIVAAIGFLGDTTSPSMIQMFKYQQYYSLKTPTVEQVKKASENSIGIPAYPKNGYIKELDDIIIVKLGEDK